MSGMQPGIPDTAWLWAAGLTLLAGALAACANVAWPHLIRRRDRPGDTLTTTLADHNDQAVAAGLVNELHQRTEQQP